MHALIRNGVVEKYPYTIGNLRKDNPNTSFPKRPSDESLATWGMYPVTRVDRPQIDPFIQEIHEDVPQLINGVWTQVWRVADAAPEEVERRKREKNKRIEEMRVEEYRKYSDAIFFKWQRGEATEEEWLEAVRQIKELLPYVE